MIGRWLRAAPLVFVLPMVIGCSTGDFGAVATEVPVSLTDESIVLDAGPIPAGPVLFRVSNDGTVVHELEVIQGDGSEIVVSQDVADLSASTVVEEVEDVVPGVTLDLEVDLEPGVYTLICNYPGHYQMGMVTTITVAG